MILAFGVWVGVPLWLVLRHPDRPKRPARIRDRAYDDQRGLAAM